MDADNFLQLLKKYSSKFYKEDSKINFDFDINKFAISCGKDVDNFYTCLSDHIVSIPRTLPTSGMTEAINYRLTGDVLSKILLNLNIYKEQDVVILSGDKETKEFKIEICINGQNESNNNTTVIEDVDIEANFSIRVSKNKFKAILESNDTFDFIIYNVRNASKICRFEYTKDNYDMKITLAELRKKKI